MDNMGKWFSEMNAREVYIIEFDAEEQSDGSYVDRSGDVYWYNEEGDIHREDGPAVVWEPPSAYAASYTAWWLDGKEFKFDEWIKLTPISDEQKMLLRLRYA